MGCGRVVGAVKRTTGGSPVFGALGRTGRASCSSLVFFGVERRAVGCGRVVGAVKRTEGGSPVFGAMGRTGRAAGGSRVVVWEVRRADGGSRLVARVVGRAVIGSRVLMVAMERAAGGSRPVVGAVGRTARCGRQPRRHEAAASSWGGGERWGPLSAAASPCWRCVCWRAAATSSWGCGERSLHCGTVRDGQWRLRVQAALLTAARDGCLPHTAVLGLSWPVLASRVPHRATPRSRASAAGATTLWEPPWVAAAKNGLWRQRAAAHLTWGRGALIHSRHCTGSDALTC